MSGYKTTIGLEVHAELNTATKMFCRSKNDADEVLPNTNVCPVCLAHPGTLPVINEEAVKHVLRVGLALNGTLADYTEFDRKNYFYPDLPKGYQLSQYEFPLVSGGSLNGVAITRVHLEEDTASSSHDDVTGSTLIDYNRAGVPLMELVTEPVIHSAEEAGAFARELQLLLRHLGASDADMEKGQMRLEANISVSKTDTLGTKVEIKNINSFRTMERAVAYEIQRQVKVLEKGEVVVQETRGWDDAKQATFPQRVKEGSADYRYFPDPDLPSLRLSELPEYSKERLLQTLPELPAQKRERYNDLGIKAEDAELYIRESSIGRFFNEVVQMLRNDAAMISLASNYIANDLVSMLRDSEERDSELHADISISPRNFAKLIELLAQKKISSRSGKDLLERLVKEDGDPEKMAIESNLIIKEVDLGPVIDTLLAEHVAVVSDYRAGKSSALEFLVGQGMRKLKGAADASALREALRAALG